MLDLKRALFLSSHMKPAVRGHRGAVESLHWLGLVQEGPRDPGMVNTVNTCAIVPNDAKWRMMQNAAKLDKWTWCFLVGGLEHEFYFPIYWEFHHPNWRSYFSEGWLNHPPVFVFSVWFRSIELIDFLGWTITMSAVVPGEMFCCTGCDSWLSPY